MLPLRPGLLLLLFARRLQSLPLSASGMQRFLVNSSFRPSAPEGRKAKVKRQTNLWNGRTVSAPLDLARRPVEGGRDGTESIGRQLALRQPHLKRGPQIVHRALQLGGGVSSEPGVCLFE